MGVQMFRGGADGDPKWQMYPPVLLETRIGEKKRGREEHNRKRERNQLLGGKKDANDFFSLSS